MKLYFQPKRCPSCQKSNDAKADKCAHCGFKYPDAGLFAHHLPVPLWKEILFYLLGFLGLLAVVTILQIIVGTLLVAQEGLSTTEELAEALRRPSSLAVVEFIGYGVVFATICLILWKNWKNLLGSFKGYKPFLAGLLGFLIILAVEFLYNVITGTILRASGIPTGENANQTTLISIIGYSPVLSFFIFAIVGPFVEEITYRVGLFGFLSRFGKVLGFILTSLVFALMHFDFEIAFSGTNAGIIEWVQLPVYMFSGFAFAFLYDRFGFASSFFCHFLNNGFAILEIILKQHLS